MNTDKYPFEFYAPRINVLREMPLVADDVPGVFFYSKNPGITPEFLHSFLLRGYLNLPDNVKMYKAVTDIAPVPEDRLTHQERDRLIEMGINFVSLMESTLVVAGVEVKGLPFITLDSLIVTASLSVWVRKLVRTLISTVAVYQELDPAWAQVRAILDSRLRDFKNQRLLANYEVDLLDIHPECNTFSLFIQSSGRLLLSHLLLDFSMTDGRLLQRELTYKAYGQTHNVSNIGSLFENDEVRDTLSDSQPWLDLKFDDTNPSTITIISIPGVSGLFQI